MALPGGGVVEVVSVIDQFRMHDVVPVSLAPLRDLYTIRYAPMSSHFLGSAYRGDPESAIIVNSTLHPWEQRAVLAHEAAHILYRHPNSFYMCRLSQWLYERYEVAAWQGAATMLICKQDLRRLALERATIQEMAAAFEVPEFLLQLRLRQVVPA